MGLIILTEPDTGFPLSLLDVTSLTNIITGSVGALAVNLLSNKDAKCADFIGSGVQTGTQLECMIEIRKKDIYEELGEIVIRVKKDREKHDQITLFNSTGLAIRDVACGYAVYKNLEDNNDIQRISFF